MKKSYLYVVLVAIAVVAASIPTYIMLSREPQPPLTPLSINYNNATYIWRDNFSKEYGYDNSPTLMLGNISALTDFGQIGSLDSTLSTKINGSSVYVPSVGNSDILFIYISVSGNLSPTLQPKGLSFHQSSTGPSDIGVTYAEFEFTALRTTNVSVSNIVPSYTGYRNLTFSAQLENSTPSGNSSPQYYFAWVFAFLIMFTPPAIGQFYHFDFSISITGLSQPVSSGIDLEVTQWNQ